jgi:YceI-like domain
LAERRSAFWVAAAVTALLGACANQIPAPPEVTTRGPAEFPEADYYGMLARGEPVFRLDSARSFAVIVVRRSGSLAQFGHDHVVASHDVAGYIAPDQGRADLYVPLDALVVDEPALRSEIGLDTQPSPADVAGTRSNMLEKVLETDRYPYALIAVKGAAASLGGQPLQVAVSLHGVTRSVDVPVQYRRAADEVTASGALAIDQSGFGIVPFSVLGGAIAVQDRVNITFQIVASRVR